jgi:trypsin
MHIPFVIKGSQISIQQAPWQVAIVDANDAKTNPYGAQFCGGSIIGASWVLTAAHCVDGYIAKDISIIAGRSLLPQSSKGVTLSNVKSIVIHPLYDWQTAANDIALIELSSPLKLSTASGTTIRSIPLAQTPPTSGSLVRVSGWGVTKSANRIEDEIASPTLQAGETVIVDCPDEWSSPEDESLICASNEMDNNKALSCFGDSGGPLTRNVNNAETLVGIVSFGAVEENYNEVDEYYYKECSDPGASGYTNVHHFNSWIMCHAAVTSPFGGPYFCGDESGWITVADTLKVAKGAWGGTTPARIVWSEVSNNNNGTPRTTTIARQTGTALSLKDMWGKRIHVRIAVGSIFRDYYFNYGAAQPDSIADYSFLFDQSVQEAFFAQFYKSGDFVPCTAVNTFVPPNKGSCAGKAGQIDGAMQSSPGLARDADGYDYPQGFWAYRDVTLPPRTQVWTWGVFDAWSRGDNMNTDYWEDDLGSPYIGAIAPDKPSPMSPPFRVDDDGLCIYDYPFCGFDLVSTFEMSTEDHYKRRTFVETSPSMLPPQCFDYISGPAENYYNEEVDACITSFSSLMVKGKGRVWMGTYGSDPLGTRFTFDTGVVYAFHR